MYEVFTGKGKAEGERGNYQVGPLIRPSTNKLNHEHTIPTQDVVTKTLDRYCS